MFPLCRQVGAKSGCGLHWVCWQWSARSSRSIARVLRNRCRNLSKSSSKTRVAKPRWPTVPQRRLRLRQMPLHNQRRVRRHLCPGLRAMPPLLRPMKRQPPVHAGRREPRRKPKQMPTLQQPLPARVHRPPQQPRRQLKVRHLQRRRSRQLQPSRTLRVQAANQALPGPSRALVCRSSSGSLVSGNSVTPTLSAAIRPASASTPRSRSHWPAEPLNRWVAAAHAAPSEALGVCDALPVQSPRGAVRFPARWPAPGHSHRAADWRARNAETHGSVRHR